MSIETSQLRAKITEWIGLVVVIIIILGLCTATWFTADHHAVAREREKAVHECAGEYYIDPETYDRKFRYHQPIAAPTPFGRIEAIIPPFDPQL
jgi:hypothetical protein